MVASNIFPLLLRILSTGVFVYLNVNAMCGHDIKYLFMRIVSRFVLNCTCVFHRFVF